MDNKRGLIDFLCILAGVLFVLGALTETYVEAWVGLYFAASGAVLIVLGIIDALLHKRNKPKWLQKSAMALHVTGSVLGIAWGASHIVIGVKQLHAEGWVAYMLMILGVAVIAVSVFRAFTECPNGEAGSAKHRKLQYTANIAASVFAGAFAIVMGILLGKDNAEAWVKYLYVGLGVIVMIRAVFYAFNNKPDKE